MAVSRLKTWIAGEVLTAADQNAEFNNILNNGQDVAFPATKAVDLDGNELILDSDADTSITADTDDRIDLKLSGVDLFRFDGTAVTPVNGLDFVAAAAGSEPSITARGSDTDISITLTPIGTGSVNLAAAINHAEGSDVASATTTDIWATGGNTSHVTGTTTITSLGTAPNAGAVRWVIFDDILTLTHGANLNLPGSADITTAAGDFARVYADTTTQLDVQYFKADGSPIVGGVTLGTPQATTSGNTKTFPISSGTKIIFVSLVGVSSSSTGDLSVQAGDGGGFEISGYTSTAVEAVAGTASQSTSSFLLTSGPAAADVYSGTIVLSLQDSSTNQWTSNGNLHNPGEVHVSAGEKALSAELTNVRLLVDAGTFDAGSVNVSTI